MVNLNVNMCFYANNNHLEGKIELNLFVDEWSTLVNAYVSMLAGRRRTHVQGGDQDASCVRACASPVYKPQVAEGIACSSRI
jgi:hypothetical protein